MSIKGMKLTKREDLVGGRHVRLGFIESRFAADPLCSADMAG